MVLTFSENEKVLCFHGPLIYEAKVLKGELWQGKEPPEENGPHYFIHYKGWKQTWDEWVPETRVLKYNDENLKRQAELTDSLSAKKSKASDKKAAGESAGEKSASKKRAREAGENEEEFLKKPEVKIPISEQLKIMLVDDWENITKNRKLVALPRSPCVSEILNSFKEYYEKEHQGKDSANEDYLQEIVEGLKAYFDKALGNILLYRFERPQYVELKKKFADKNMSDVYGAEHLLRLFVQLPQLLAHTNMDGDAINICKDYFVEVIKYIESNSAALLTQNYENATPSYEYCLPSTTMSIDNPDNIIVEVGSKEFASDVPLSLLRSLYIGEYFDGTATEIDGHIIYDETKKKYPPVRALRASDKKRILVTGGAGFVGSHLVDRLMLMGHEVVVLDNFFTGKKRNIQHWVGHPNFEVVRHDVVDHFMIEVDQIYHLACPASPPHYQYNPIKTVKTSVMGTINMLGLAKRVKARFLLASTSEVYGDPEEHPQKESYWGNVNPIGPRACYDEGKRVAETLTYAYAKQDKVDVRVARIFNTFGPRMNAEDGRVVSNFIVQALKGEDITVYGAGSQTRSFQYVHDLVDGLIQLMNCSCTEPVNIGNPEEFTIQEFAEMIRDMVENEGINIINLPALTDDPRRRRPDISKALRHTGWAPRFSVRQGIRETVEYFRQYITDL
ncbi:UDP-glucuronic acid decarboxylase 1 [Phlyctochytrium planicorne]|nr:UDP-glucuronic acid decarboxylase 1 [Phlyctochytrium planicorne]